MSPARWEKLPVEARARVPRRQSRSPRLVFRCGGAGGCGALLRDGYPKAERHVDEHGGARIEIVIDQP